MSLKKRFPINFLTGLGLCSFLALIFSIQSLAQNLPANQSVLE
jgi:hypothetical protein